MNSFAFLGAGIACFVAGASLLAGLLRAAKASSQVTEEQDESVQNDKQEAKEDLANLTILRSAS